MRVHPVLVLLIAGCGSEHDLLSDVEDERVPTTETTPPETVVDPALASLEGVVCAPDGESAVSFAKVTVHHDGGPSQATTDGDGSFRIHDLPAGTWEVEIRKGSFVTLQDVLLTGGQVASLAVDESDCTPVEQGETTIAVVTGQYDRIEQVLDALDLDYDVIPGISGSAYVDFLRDPDALAAYDVIFFNCGMGVDWLPYKQQVGGNLRDFVQDGGSVYASDWAYYLVEMGWPAQHDFFGPENNATGALVGDVQQITADVIDPAMQAALGSDTADLRYDLGGWAGMEGANAEVLIAGSYQYWDVFNTGSVYAPLATRLRDGEGTVLYTSFHNEGQNTVDMLKLLQEIILSL